MIYLLALISSPSSDSSFVHPIGLGRFFSEMEDFGAIFLKECRGRRTKLLISMQVSFMLFEAITVSSGFQLIPANEMYL